MTATATEEAPGPVVLIVSATELARNIGKVWREVASGAAVRVDDGRTGQTVGWISGYPPAHLAAMLADLPAPGEVSDRLGPDE